MISERRPLEFLVVEWVDKNRVNEALDVLGVQAVLKATGKLVES